EGDGELQVLLLLQSEALQPLPFRALALPLGPLHLLRLIPKLQRGKDTCRTLQNCLPIKHTHTRTYILTHLSIIILYFCILYFFYYYYSFSYCLSKRNKNMFSFPLYSLLDCSIPEEGFSSLALALRSNPSHMRLLWLNRNKAGDSGVKHLSSLLEDPNCNLETLE